MTNWTKATPFTDRAEFEAFVAEAKANNTFVKSSERRVMVRKSTPAASAVRPRFTFTVYTK